MSASATLKVPRDHPAFAGHFPNSPVLPGAALLDETLEILRAERGMDIEDWQIASVKFLSAVGPGEVLVVEHAAAGREIHFIVRCADRRVASGRLAPRSRQRSATLADASP